MAVSAHIRGSSPTYVGDARKKPLCGFLRAYLLTLVSKEYQHTWHYLPTLPTEVGKQCPLLFYILIDGSWVWASVLFEHPFDFNGWPEGMLTPRPTDVDSTHLLKN
jgi:hypothetical protein